MVLCTYYVNKIRKRISSNNVIHSTLDKSVIYGFRININCYKYKTSIINNSKTK